MNRYDVPELIQLWEQGALTNEQMIKQLLLHLQDLQNRAKALEQQGQQPGVQPGGQRPPKRPASTI